MASIAEALVAWLSMGLAAAGRTSGAVHLADRSPTRRAFPEDVYVPGSDRVLIQVQLELDIRGGQEFVAEIVAEASDRLGLRGTSTVGREVSVEDGVSQCLCHGHHVVVIEVCNGGESGLQ